MGQVLHGCATTTEAIRRAIQNSQESLRVLAARPGGNCGRTDMCRSRLASLLKTECLRYGLSQRKFGELLEVSGTAIGKSSAADARGLCNWPSPPRSYSTDQAGPCSRSSMKPSSTRSCSALSISNSSCRSGWARSPCVCKRAHLRALINRLQFPQS